jgi:hypothetical protein
LSKNCKKNKINFSDNILNEKKQAKGKNNPKLLTVQTEIKTPNRNTSYQRRG